MGDPEDDDDDEPINPLVDALFDEVEDLRMQVCILISLLDGTTADKESFLFGRSFSNLRCAVQ